MKANMADLNKSNPLSSAQQNKKRARSENWSPDEKALLAEMVEENFGILLNKKTNVETNAKKQKVWEGIALAVTALGTSTRTWDQCRDKWHKMCTSGKEYISKKKRAASKTGGGPAMEEDTEDPLLEKVGALHKGNPSWHGIRGGSETGPTSSSSATALPAPRPSPQASTSATAAAKSDYVPVWEVGDKLDELERKCAELNAQFSPVTTDKFHIDFQQSELKDREDDAGKCQQGIWQRTLRAEGQS
ncbi:uncharacterized protein LOC135493613 [Lineus longissimus]|uniref:uncharacterized protein LOC135493613 n=1 Tax=Lineus longissimus TaxID=88925 RepID=UPI00315CE656